MIFTQHFRIYCLRDCRIATLALSTFKRCVHNTDVADTPMQLYEEKLRTGELRKDAHQRIIVEELQKLHTQLDGYRPAPLPKEGGFFSKLFGSSSGLNKDEDKLKRKSAFPKGLYLYGSVGCGKTMLMDFFYHTCHIERSQRVHFHAFMVDVHKRIHAFKATIPREYNVRKMQPFDPIPPVAKAIAEESWLLCFDEFQVTDIADAMILKRLFKYFWEYGVVVVATSNRHPDDLYKNGLQRMNFMPFIPMLKGRCKLINLGSGIDYRRLTMPADGQVYFVNSECEADYELNRIYDFLTSEESADIDEGPQTLEVMGRKVTLPKTCGRIADCTFHDLCMKPLGAVDYLEICQAFDTIIIRNIPRMDLEKKSEARRFINLIDTIYDNRVQLVCSAENSPDHLFATKNESSDHDKHFARVLMADLNIALGSENASASIFTGEEELFAFERVASRLTEMQTEEYWYGREIYKKMKEKEKEKRAKRIKSQALG